MFGNFGIQRSQPSLEDRFTLLENVFMINPPRVATLESRMNDADTIMTSLEARINQTRMQEAGRAGQCNLPAPAAPRVAPEDLINQQYFENAQAAASAPAAPTQGVASHRGIGTIVPGVHRGFSQGQQSPATSVVLTSDLAEGAPVYTEEPVDRNPSPLHPGASPAPQFGGGGVRC